MVSATKPSVLVQSDNSTEPSVRVFGRTHAIAIVIAWEDVNRSMRTLADRLRALKPD